MLDVHAVELLLGRLGGDGTLDLPAAAVDGKVLQLGKRRFARVQVDRP